MIRRMTREENGTLTAAPLAVRQPEPAEPSVADATVAVQYVKDESFRRSLEKIATLHEQLLAKLAE